MSWSFLCSGSSVRIIDDCLFCGCRGVSCVQGVNMIDDCSFCRCSGHSSVQSVLLR
jgi:hypothetical protein